MASIFRWEGSISSIFKKLLFTPSVCFYWRFFGSDLIIRQELRVGFQAHVTYRIIWLHETEERHDRKRRKIILYPIFFKNDPRSTICGSFKLSHLWWCMCIHFCLFIKLNLCGNTFSTVDPESLGRNAFDIAKKFTIDRNSG